MTNENVTGTTDPKTDAPLSALDENDRRRDVKNAIIRIGCSHCIHIAESKGKEW